MRKRNKVAVDRNKDIANIFAGFQKQLFDKLVGNDIENISEYEDYTNGGIKMYSYGVLMLRSCGEHDGWTRMGEMVVKGNTGTFKEGLGV